MGYVLPYPLDSYGEKSTSQNDEDGIIDVIRKHIPMKQYFVEFGVDPHEGNCLHLYHQGWAGLFMDTAKGDRHDNPIPIHKEWVSAMNIMELLTKYNVPHDLGILSIDIDGQDYWVWREIEHFRYDPSLVIIEYNGLLGIDHEFVIPRQDDFVIQTHAYGASLKTMNSLGEKKGYTLVYANGVNGFFVQSHLLSNRYDFQYEKVYKPWRDGQQAIQGDPLKMGFVRWKE